MKSLNSFTAFLVRSAIGVIENYLIASIKDPTLKRAMTLGLRPFRGTIDALSDKIEMNEEQVKEVWNLFVSGELPDFAEKEIAVRLEKIKNENTKAVLSVLADPVVDIFRLLTDANKDNEAQINARLKELVQDPASLKTLVQNIAIPIAEKIKDEKAREFLLAFLQSILEGEVVIAA